MDAGFFKGTSTDQDKRFSDKEAKLLKTMKFPPVFDVKVDMRKVNLQVMRPWVVKKIIELVGFEDEVVVEYAMGLLEDSSKPTPDPRLIQINLTGFLTNSTPEFMKSLWTLLIEAQNSEVGVPKSFVDEKKEEMRTAKSNFNQQNKGAATGRPQGSGRPTLDEIRDRERRERAERGGGGGGGGGGGRGGRGRGRGFGRFDEGAGRGSSNGNYAERSRDSGWGAKRNNARMPSRSRSRSAPRQSTPRRSFNRSRSRSVTPPQRTQMSRRRDSHSPPPADTPPASGGRRHYSASPSPSRSPTPSAPPTGRTFQSTSRSPSISRNSYTQRRDKPQSRSPPRRYRRSPTYSPPRRSSRTHDRKRSFSRSRSPRPVQARRRRSYSRSPTPSAPPSPRGEREPRRKRRRTSRSYSRERSYSPRRYESRTPDARERRRTDDDEDTAQETPPHSELKIKGSANASSSRTSHTTSKHKPLGTRLSEKESPSAKNGLTLQQKERELKEAALRNKLVKSKARKNSMTEED